VWSGLGVVLISIIGIIFYNERLDLPAVIGIGMIIAGVAIIQIFSKIVPH
jgi:small multidrug resistance pump